MALLVGMVGGQVPGWLDERKRLPLLEAERKKPGWVWTAYPSVGYDPNRRLGAALQANVTYNGSREDSFFLVLPYRQFWGGQVGFFLREVWYGRFAYEWLWPGGRPYRLMIRAEARQDGQIQLWGMDARTLLYDLRRHAPGGQLATYYQALTTPFLDSTGSLRTREAYHRLLMQRFQVWLIGERLLSHGLLRVSAGLRYLYEKTSSLTATPYRLKNGQTALQSPTLLDSLRQTNPFSFLQGTRPRLFWGMALIWDSRDFEIDPHKGLLMEVAHEIAPLHPVNKTHLYLRTYFPLYEKPGRLPRLILAMQTLIYGTYGKAVPLWDLYYVNSWADARRLEALSGPSFLRGYLENRFIAPFGQIYQSELRLMLLEKNLLRQNFIAGPVAFIEAGTGANHPLQWTYPWKLSLGVGGRVLWNLQTILRADAAYGLEGWQLIFTTRHAF